MLNLEGITMLDDGRISMRISTREVPPVLADVETDCATPTAPTQPLDTEVLGSPVNNMGRRHDRSSRRIT